MFQTSCPGKVLLAGGYLVLDPSYSGLVIATDDARIHISLSSSPSGSGFNSDGTSSIATEREELAAGSSVIDQKTALKSSKIRIISPQV
jgi:hypothetical protein